MGFDKWTMSYIHHQRLIQNNVTTLKKNIPFASRTQSLIPSHKFLSITDLFTITTVSPFPEYHKYNYNYMTCSLFGLTSFTEQSAFKIHQKCFSSHLLTCLAKLCSSLKIHIKYYSFGKTCGFTHIVLLYPFSQSSLFIFFMALITFNFTHI